MSKQIVRATMEGRKKTGRPRTRWRDKFEGTALFWAITQRVVVNSLSDVWEQSIRPFWTLEDETDMLSRNVGKDSTLLAA